MGLGMRLREERQRLDVDQTTFGSWGGVQALAQRNYESGKRFPDGMYLEAVAARGVDVQYVITGQRAISAAQLEDDVRRMSDAWETFELALVHFERAQDISPSKKRIAAEALYRISKQQVDKNPGQLMEYAREMLAMAA